MKKIYLIFAVLGITLFIYIYQARIRRVTCFSQFGPCNANIRQKLEGFVGKNYWKEKDKINDLLSHEVLVSDFRFHKTFANTLSVNLDEKKGKVAISDKDRKSFAYLDEGGMIIFYSSGSSLPVIEIDKPLPSVGEKVAEEIRFSGKILEEIFRLHGSKNGYFKGDRTEIPIGDSYNVIFPRQGDIKALVASLDLIVSRLNTKNERSKIEIDLRFKNPVLRYGQR